MSPTLARVKEGLERLLLDPVMRREVIGVSHRPSSYVFRTAYVVVLAGMLYIIWTFVEGSGTRSYTKYAAAGSRLFAWFAYVQFAMAILAGFVLGADLLPRETRSRTLELILVTPLTPRGIVWGKWKACAAYLVMVVFSSAPVLAITSYMGGVSGVDFIGVYMVTVTWGGLAAAMALYYSTRFETIYATVAMSAFLLVMYLLFSICCGVPFNVASVEGAEMAVAWINPAWALYGSVTARSWVGELGWIGASVTGVLLTGLFLKLTVDRVSSPWRREAAAMSPDASFATPAPTAAAARPLSGRIKWLTLSEDMLERNPMLWKELQWRARSGASTFIRVALIVLAAMAPFFCLTLMSGVGKAGVEFMTWAVLLALWSSAVTSGSEAFTVEKERNMWEVLMATPLSARRILSAKLASRVRAVAPFLGVLAVVLGGTWLSWRGGFRGLAIAFTAHAIFAAFLTTFGMFVSLCVRTTRTALSITGLVFFLMVGLVGAITAAWGISGADRATAEAVDRALNPYAFHGAIVQPENPGGKIGLTELRTAQTYGRSLIWFGSLYGGATGLMLMLMLSRMRAIGRRYLG